MVKYSNAEVLGNAEKDKNIKAKNKYVKKLFEEMKIMSAEKAMIVLNQARRLMT